MNYLRRRDVWGYACICAVIMLVLYNVIFLRHVFYVGDSFSLIAPMKDFLINTLKSGHIPLWNPYIFSGLPYVADINNGAFYPLNFLYLFTSPLHAMSWNIVIAIAIGAGGMYAYMRRLTLSVIPSLAGAFVFVFSGTVLQMSQNTAALDVIVWMPILLLMTDKYLQSNQTRYIAATSFILTIMLFAGHIQFFYYACLLWTSYVFFRFGGQYKKKLIYFILSCVIFLGLAAVQLIPFLELTTFSSRPAFDYNFSTGGTFPLISIAHLVFAYAFGAQRDGTSWGAQANIFGYVGILPFFLILWYIKHKKLNREGVFFLVIAFIAFLISLGKYSPLYTVAFYTLPFFSRFRAPGGILTIYTFAIAVLSAFSLQHFFKLLAAKKRHSVQIFSVLAPCMVALILALFFTKQFGYQPFYQAVVHANKIHAFPFLVRFLEYSTYQIHSIYNIWIDNLLVLSAIGAFFCMVSLYALKKRVTWWIPIALSAILVADVLYFGRSALITAPEQSIRQPVDIRSSAIKDIGDYRIYTLYDGPAKPIFGDKNYFKKEALKSQAYVKPDNNIEEGLYSIDGYASVVLKRYNQFVSPKNTSPTSIGSVDLKGDVLNLLAVKYVVTGGYREAELQANNRYTLVGQYRAPLLRRSFRIYENLSALPRAYVITQSGETQTKNVKIVSSNVNEVRIKLSHANGLLIFSDALYPGWHAYVDGREVNILPYKQILRSVVVRDTNHEVKFVFKPISVYVGFAISVTTVLLLLLFFAFHKWNKRVA